MSATELKEYIVTVNNFEDLDSLYEDMQSPGGNLYIPNRRVDIAELRPMSPSTHFMLSDDEVEQVKKDPRVKYVILPYWALGYEIGRAADTVQTSTKWNKSWPNNSQDKNWGLLREFNPPNMSGWGANSPSSKYSKSGSISLKYTGQNVDVVVMDGHISKDHPEFAVNPDGTGGSRVIQYNWFQHMSTVSPDKTNLIGSQYSYALFSPADDNHATHVAGTIAGNTQGYARKANIYNIYMYQNSMFGNNWIYYTMDFIRAWHNSKPINPSTGRKNPTILNQSWAMREILNPKDIVKVNFNGVERPASPSLKASAGLDRQFANDPIGDVTAWSNEWKVSIRDASIDTNQESAIADGIINVAAADNFSNYCDLPNGKYWNDWFDAKTLYSNGNVRRVFYHRGPSPAAANGVIMVSAADNTMDDRKVAFSNAGPRTTIFAPGTAIMSSVAHSGSTAVPDPRNPNYFIDKYWGTSMATPQVVGILACALEKNPNFNQAQAKDYLITNAESGKMSDAKPSPNQLQNVNSLWDAPNLYARFPNELKGELPAATAETDDSTDNSVVAVDYSTWNEQFFQSNATWTCPANVTSVSVICVGSGGGSGAGGAGGGGGLGWKNSISVTPGQTYTVTVGQSVTGFADGQSSYFINESTVAGLGGKAGETKLSSISADDLPLAFKGFKGGLGGGFVGEGGGNGGNGGAQLEIYPTIGFGFPGGGGAGGYTGAGGNGGRADGLYADGRVAGNAKLTTLIKSTSSTPSQGGGGKGGNGGSVTRVQSIGALAFGGGVNLFGPSTSGLSNGTVSKISNGRRTGNVLGYDYSYIGGAFGGGASVPSFQELNIAQSQPSTVTIKGGPGAVRIIWPGDIRKFPSTNVDTTPTFKITSNVASVAEGSTVTFTVETRGIPDSTSFYWENTGTATSSDFTDGINSGSVVISSGTGKIVRTLVNDFTTEGEESIIIGIHNGTVPKKVLATAATVKVLDTSTPTYAISVNTVKINEGQTITYTITTRGVPDNTELNWENIGKTKGNDFTDTLNSGTVAISNNTATLTRTLANDLTTEGNETVQIQLKRNGLNVALSDTTLVLDTSVLPPPTYAISADKASVDEGGSVTYTITTTNLPNGTTLYWNTKLISGISSGDFEDVKTSGSVTINNNTATFVRTLRLDNTTEGGESLILELRAINSNGTIVATATPVTVNDTSKFLVPTYAISADKASVDEGGSVTYTITTTNVPNGRQLYWINKGTAQGNDFTDISPQGVVIINNNSGTIVRTLVNDNLTEVVETISLEVRDGSYSGTIVIPASSNLVTVNDTSKTPDPTYSIEVVGNSLTTNEGLFVTYSIKTTRVANNTLLYWTNSGTTNAEDFVNNKNSGSFTISSNASNLSLQLKQDKKTEGSETIVMQIRTGSITGPIVATAPAVTVNDTSKG